MGTLIVVAIGLVLLFLAYKISKFFLKIAFILFALILIVCGIGSCSCMMG